MTASMFEKIRRWYYRRLGRIVLLFLVVVLFTLTVAYIPYLNVLLGSLGILVSLITFYILFPPSTKVLIYISVIASFIACMLLLAELNFIVDLIGNLLFLLLIFIFINYGKSIHEQKER